MSSESDPAPDDDREPRAPNLTLLYTLLGAGLLLAIGIALLVVFPLYRHRH
jgi:hypothetical protein